MTSVFYAKHDEYYRASSGSSFFHIKVTLATLSIHALVFLCPHLLGVLQNLENTFVENGASTFSAFFLQVFVPCCLR